MTTDQPRMSCFIQLEGKDQIKEKKKKKKSPSKSHFISFHFNSSNFPYPFHSTCSFVRFPYVVGSSVKLGSQVSYPYPYP